MTGGKARARAIGGAAALIVAGAASIAIAGGGYTVETETGDIPAESAKSVVVNCPRGSALTGGGYTALATSTTSDLVVTGAFPAGRRFKVRGFSFDTTPDTLRAHAICAANGDFVVRSKVFEDEPGSSTGRARCPRGASVTGGGVNPPTANDTGLIASRPAGRRAWVGAVHLSSAGTFRVYAICDKGNDIYGTIKASASPPPVRAARRGIPAVITLNPGCPPGVRLTGGGFSAADAAGRFSISRPRGRVWKVKVDAYAGTDATYTAYARCKLSE